MITGQELVTNGTFTTDSGWNKGTGWSISAGAAVATTTTSTIDQSIDIVAGREYTASFDITDYTSGGVLMVVGNTPGASRSSVGTFTETFTATSGALVELTTSGAPTDLSIDNVTVKEVSTASEIEEAIYDVLRLDSTVSGIVSERIYPLFVPQDVTMEAITYQEISGLRDHTLTDTVNMVTSRFQINCWTLNMPDARALANAVRLALDNFADTVGTVVIQVAFLDDEDDLNERRPGTDVIGRMGKRLDFRIFFNE